MGVADLGSAQLSTTTIVTASPGPAAQDPCSSYTTLNDTWRATTNLDQYGSKCDRDVTWQGCSYTTLDNTWRATTNLDQSVIRCDYGVSWQGWYRMMHQGVSVRMADSCVPNHRNYSTLDDTWRATTNLDRSVIRCDRDVNWQGWYRMMHQGKSVRMADSCVPTARCGTEPEPCSSYSTLDDTWRATNNLDQYGSKCDRDVTWQGWYRMMHQGVSVRMADSCVPNHRCGTHAPLWLSGGHPQPEDGIVTRSVCEHWSSCCYNSFSIRVKACPGNYTVYELRPPPWCNVAYCTDVSTTPVPTPPTPDPCSNYTTLNDTWRATTNLDQSVIRCDYKVNFQGWYRMMHQGQSVRMADSCVPTARCGTYYPLWLSGGHPQPEDGIVTRSVCGTRGSCCSYSYSIRVKACPANYTVYELQPTRWCNDGYCTEPEPCSSYTTLNDTWRAVTNLDQYGSKCDRDVTWQGWYRMMHQGVSVRMPDSCVPNHRCGTHAPLWLSGGHPQPEDGIVTRSVCEHWSTCCRYSFSIRVKECPGNYTVYELRPPPWCNVAYCTAPDPCSNYSTLDDSWRASTNLDQSVIRCDRDVNWQGWYRMMHQGKSVRMADSCVPYDRCGTDYPLWLSGGHPQPEDGIVTRSVCGNTGSCCSYSYSIRVKACPGNYTVYELQPTRWCYDAYCTEPEPCTSYSTLDDTWRATTNLDQSVIRCDRDVNWQGWYRMMYLGKSVRMADSCVPNARCGTHYPLWLSGGHPQPEDGIVTRSWWGTFRPVSRHLQSVMTQPHVSPLKRGFTANAKMVPYPTSMRTRLFFAQVVVSLLKALEDELPQVASQKDLAARGGAMLQSTEKLVATLVETTFTQSSKTLTTNTTEVKTFAVGKNTTVTTSSKIESKNVSMDIDLIGIARNNHGAAAVALTSFTEMGSILKADFFHTINNTQKTMMSPILTASLPKTTNKTLTSPANFTIIHIKEADPQGQMSCVYWDGSVWLVDGCDVTHTNSTHTVCTCVHFSTFSLIMQTERPSEQDPMMELMNRILLPVGLGSLTLALLTFALCHKNTTVATPARLNLCASLLLAHLLFLLVQEFLHLIQPHKVICSVLSGVLHVLFLSSFAWMFLETIWLLRSVLRLKEFRSAQNDGPHWGYQCLIGYGAPFTVVAISAGLVPEGYGSDSCWLKYEKGFMWSFLGPVCCILGVGWNFFFNVF
ncbi:hypothetical protein ACEWY4_017316 [Coilia grayii]|uniref:Uncharacterized protein n=1 Tax=Coilia grayii TaxID=363190 RepID=A0ABD1JGG8_9TELE